MQYKTEAKFSTVPLKTLFQPESKELEIFTVFVFSFHPNFVTAGDRSFAVHCIFLQQQVTVATKFNFIS
uniref:Cuticlin N-terminal domain-containing protein n=1 Tax=Parascaris equorum TaxID=6256 RepID=A0A914S063_PAREQ